MTSEANEFDNVFFVVESNQQQVIFDMAFHKSIIIVGQFSHTNFQPKKFGISVKSRLLYSFCRRKY